MHLATQSTSIIVSNWETSYAPSPIPQLITLSAIENHLILRTGSAYADEDCTTSTTPPPVATTSSNTGAAGAGAVITPSCTVTKLSDAVIALGVLCGFSIIGFIVLLILFIRQSNSSQDRSSSRNRDSIPPRSHPSSPLFHDHLRDSDTHSRRRRVYNGLGIGGSRDGRLHRRHSMHENPLVRDLLERSPLAPPPRYMERAPENMPQPQNAGMFPRSPGRRGVFARSPLAMPGLPFMRNQNINPMAFPQAQGGLADMQMPQMPHAGHMHQQQPPMYQQPQHTHQAQPGMMQPEPHHHAPAAMADMRAAQEQAQQRGSMRPEEGNIGRSRDPSSVGMAVRDDAFGGLRRQPLGSSRPSRSETEGSRGRRGGLFNGGPPGPL